MSTNDTKSKTHTARITRITQLRTALQHTIAPARTIQFPTRGNYSFHDLPEPLQALIKAADALEEAMSQLDIAELRQRPLELSDDAEQRAEWRWHQGASLAAWHLYEEVQLRAQLGYALYLAEQQAAAEAVRGVTGEEE